MSYQNNKQTTHASLKNLVLDQMNTLSKGKFTSAMNLTKNWHNIMGPNLAQHCQVLYVKSDMLFIGVENSTWMNELGFMKDQILHQIKTYDPNTPIKSIKLKLRPLVS